MSHLFSNRRDSIKTLAALGTAASSPFAFAQKPITVGVIYVGPRDDFGYNQAQAQAAAASTCGQPQARNRHSTIRPPATRASNRR